MQIDFSGTRVGAYTLQAEIGHGGMGRVYRASRPDTTQLFAIKIVNPLTTRDEKFEQRFWREISVVNRLNHPAILQVYASGQEEDGTLYMVMPLITGGTIKDLLLRQQTMTPAEACRMVSQIGEGLDYAHTQGVIHRDVKPHNIMILGEGQYCLTDFGVASLASLEETVSNLTSTGATLGTFAYMSPEQIAGGTLDGRADIYSLGVVLYQVLLGRLPFAGDNTAVVLSQQLHALPLAPHLINPDFPAEIEAVLDTTLAKRPDNRYPNGAALAQAFERACAALPEDVLCSPLVTPEQIAGADSLPNTMISRSEPAPATERRFSRRWILAGLALLALIVTACVLFVLPLQAQLEQAQGTAAALGSSTPIVVTSVVTNAAGEQVIIQVTTTPAPATATPTPTLTPVRTVIVGTTAPPATGSPQPTSAATTAQGSGTGGQSGSGAVPTSPNGSSGTTGGATPGGPTTGGGSTGADNSGGANTGGSENGGGSGNSGGGGGKGGKP